MKYNDIAEQTKATLDRLYKSRTRQEWDDLINGELKGHSELVKAHAPEQFDGWRAWVKGRTDKMLEYKKVYWENQAQGVKTYTKKEVYLLREETEKKLQTLLDVLINKYSQQ